jgi:cell division protein FtsB
LREPAKPPRNPRPLAAFFLSLLGSSVVLGLVLLYDGRFVELKKARAEIRQLERRVADRKRENAQLRASILAANRGEFPAQKAAREELHLVHPEDVVLLYPSGSLAPAKPTPPGPVAAPSPPDAPRATASPSPSTQ